jgi:predicted nucleotidyltransferase
VGGAVVSLYVDDPAADDVRPTKDIDITLEIASANELEFLREKLSQKGFYQTSEDDVICRFRFADVKVDVMATKAIGWAPSNPWFEPGFKHLIIIDLDNLRIRCLSLPYFIATKITAYYNRGSSDPRTSHDFEDIVYILNYTSNSKDQILGSDPFVRSFIQSFFREILIDSSKQEAIIGHLFYEYQEERFEKIMTIINEVSLEL